MTTLDPTTLDPTPARPASPPAAAPTADRGRRLRVLYIAPLPPPITGHSLVSEALLGEVARRHDVTTVDLSLGSSNDGRISGRRIREVLRVLAQVRRARGRSDAVYLTISETVAGNLKDLCIYLLCRARLGRVVVHLHGGSIRRLLFDRHPLLRRLNAWCLRRIGAAVISGPSHVPIFEGMVEGARLHQVPNFAPEALFVDEAAVAAKFADPRPLRVLYVSGMLRAKGYEALTEAYLALSPEVRARIQLDVAGRFDRDDERAAYERRIAGVPGLTYHGLVDDARKRALFAAAHVFCLPTSMFEGQPISILEAYASGCVVLTTGQPGIRDVFADGVNGLELESATPEAIARALAALVGRVDALGATAMRNRRTADERYRVGGYVAAVTHIIEATALAHLPGGAVA